MEEKRARRTSMLRVVEEDDVGGAPDGGGDGAVGLGGDDDFEKFRCGGEIGHQRLLGVGWKGLHDGQLLEDGEDDFVGGSKRCFDAGAPELQQGIVFVKMPRQAGAKSDDTLETRVRLGPVRFRPREFFHRQMRIENELDAAIIFAREFADHE